MGKVGNDGQALAALGSWTTAYAQSVSQRQATQGPGPFQNGSQFGTQENDFGSRLDYANSQNQGSTAGTITTRGGETLEGIAASLWGDAGLWYKLAQANGLSGDTTLAAGQTLRIPAGVMRNTFNAATVTPTDPNDTIGDVNPTTPQAAPPKRRRCGGLGAVFMAIIAIAVTVVTSGALAAAAIKGATGTAVSLGKGIAAVFGQTVAVTSTVSAKLTAFGAMAVGAVGAAAGSIASQAFGVATGLQDRFSWNAVATAAIGGGISGGLGAIGFGGSGAAGAALRGATSSAISQGINVALGLQDRFSWAAVAAAGVAGGVVGAARGAMTARGIDASALSSRLGLGLVDALAQGATRSLLEGTDFGDNLRASLPSAIGNAIGGYIVEGSSGGISLLDWGMAAVGVGGARMNAIRAFQAIGNAGGPGTGQATGVRTAEEERIWRSATGQGASPEAANTAVWLYRAKQGFLIDIAVVRGRNPAEAERLTSVFAAAMMSHDVYYDTGIPELLMPGYQRLNSAQVSAELGDSIRLSDASSGYFSALYSGPGNTRILVNRGTEGFSAAGRIDWAENFIQGMGLESAQYTLAMRNALQMERAYGGRLSFAGHSLGGGLATAQAIITGLNATVFNAASVHPETVNRLGARETNASIAARGRSGQISHYGVSLDVLYHALKFGPNSTIPYQVVRSIQQGLRSRGIDLPEAQIIELLGQMPPPMERVRVLPNFDLDTSARTATRPFLYRPTTFDPIAAHMMDAVVFGLGGLARQRANGIRGAGG